MAANADSEEPFIGWMEPETGAGAAVGVSASSHQMICAVCGKGSEVSIATSTK